MIYSWSVSTKLRILHVRLLYSLAKNPGIEQLKSYRSWHLFLPFGTFTDATASPTMTITPNGNNRQIAKLRHVNYHGTLFSPCLSLCFLLSLSLHPVNYFWYETAGKRPTTGKRWDLACWCWQIQWRSEEAISALRCQKIKALTVLNSARI